MNYHRMVIRNEILMAIIGKNDCNILIMNLLYNILQLVDTYWGVRNSDYAEGPP
jgi:hypothetical protein